MSELVVENQLVEEVQKEQVAYEGGDDAPAEDDDAAKPLSEMEAIPCLNAII